MRAEAPASYPALRRQVAQLLWLRRRHARTELAWWAYMAGTDIVDDRDAVDRIYQLYVVAIVGGAAVATAGYLLEEFSGICAALGMAAAGPLAGLVLALPALVFAVTAVGGLRQPAFRLTRADAAFLAAGAFESRAFAMAEGIATGFAVAVVAGLAAFALGVGATAALAVPVLPPGVPVAVGLLAATGYALGRGVGYIRAASPARGMRGALLLCAFGAATLLASASALALIATAGPVGLLGALAAGGWVPAIASAACWAAAVMLVAGVFARDADLARAIEASGAYAELEGVRRLALTAPDVYRELRRRYRVAHRRWRPAVPFGQGCAAPPARALQTHLRCIEGVPRLLFVGALLIPASAFVLTCAPPPPVFAAWGYLLFTAHTAVRELSLPFREDQRVKLVRDALSFSTLRLAVLDGIPAFALVLVLAIAVLGVISALVPGIVPVPAWPVAVLLAVALALVAALEGAERPGARACRRLSCGMGVLIVAIAGGLAALLGAGAAAVALTAVCAVFARLLARSV